MRGAAPDGQRRQLGHRTGREEAWIAVLSLDNMSGNPQDNHLCDGIATSLPICRAFATLFERAIGLMKRAMRLNPSFPDWYLWYLGNEYFDMGDYEGAVRTLSRMRDKSEAHRLATSCCALLGRMREAGYHARQVMVVHPEFSIEHWRTVPPDKDAGTLELVIEGLRKAGLK